MSKSATPIIEIMAEDGQYDYNYYNFNFTFNFTYDYNDTYDYGDFNYTFPEPTEP